MLHWLLKSEWSSFLHLYKLPLLLPAIYVIRSTYYAQYSKITG